MWDTTTEDVIDKASSIAGAVDFILAFFLALLIRLISRNLQPLDVLRKLLQRTSEVSPVLQVPQSAVVLRWWWYVKS
jgi:hypothetical protein